MENQKIINLLDNTTNHQSKFRTRNWIGINDEDMIIVTLDLKRSW